MSRKIILSKKASKKLGELLEYLETEWSAKVKNDYIKKLEKSLAIIKQNPNNFQESNIKKGLHKCVITKQTTIYYKFDKDKIYVVTLFDNRQDPKKLKKEIKK